MIEETRTIPLTQGEETIVDAADYPWLSKYKWFAKWGGRKYAGMPYAARSVHENGKCKTVRMHRQIMNAEHGQEVDHRDGNTMNNCRYNLRISTKAENLENRITNRIGSRNA